MIGVNLVPETIQHTHALRAHLRWWGVTVLLAGTILAVPLGIDAFHRVRAEELRTESMQLTTELTAARASLRSMEGEARETLLHLERAKALRSKRAWSALLTLIGSCMPEGCWLSSIATDPAVPSAGSARKAARIAPRAAGSSDRKRGATKSGKRAYSRSDQERQQTIMIEAPRGLRIRGNAIDATEPFAFVARLRETGVFKDVTLERSIRAASRDASYLRFEIVCEW